MAPPCEAGLHYMENFMRIGIDIRPLMTSLRTGVGEYTGGLLSEIFSQDKKNDYWLFCNSRRDVSAVVPRWAQDNVHCVFGRCPNWALNFGLAAGHRPDLDKWISKAAGGPLDYFFSPNFNFTAVSPETKFILTVHDLSFEFFPDCYSAKMRLWHRALAPRAQVARADIILTPSENTKQDVVNHYGADEKKVKVIYPGLSPVYTHDNALADDTVRQKYRLPERFILFLGTIEPRKNILGLVEAYRLLQTLYQKQKKQPLHSFISAQEIGSRQTGAPALVIAGAVGWKDKEIRRAIAATPGVHCIDYVAPEDKPALYRLAEVFVYPSLYEGFGFPVLEAMAAGTPVITSSRSSLPEVTGDAACLVNPMNVSDLAEAVQLLLTDNGVRELYRERGRVQAAKFKWESAARQWLDLINGESF